MSFRGRPRPRFLDEDGSDGFVFLDAQEHILKSRALHVGGALAGIVVDAVRRELIFAAIIDGFLAKGKLRLQRMPVRRGLFLGGNACVNQGFVHGCDHSMQRIGKISRNRVVVDGGLFWQRGSMGPVLKVVFLRFSLRFIAVLER